MADTSRMDRLRQLVLQTALNTVRCSETTQGLAECQKGFKKLPPVPKKIRQGPKGGLYYINQNGIKIHLSKKQTEKFHQGTLIGAIDRRQ